MEKAVTIKDVAREAGVSIAAVSVALSNKKSAMRLSSAKREHIIKVAREFNYTPNIAARGFQSRKSYLLGLFLGEQNWYVQMGILQGIRSVCLPHDYDVIVYPSANLAMETQHLESALKRKVDGILTMPFVCSRGNNLEKYLECAEHEIPIIQLISHITGEFPSVGRDYLKIGYEAVKVMVKHGHRKICVFLFDNYTDKIQGPGSWGIAQGCARAASECGVELQYIPVPYSHDREIEDCSEEIAARMLKSSRLPTAIIANSSRVANGVFSSLTSNGIKIPEEISLLSCGNDIGLFLPFGLKLACFQVPVIDIGREAARRCLSLPGSFLGNELLFSPPLEPGNSIWKI